MIGSVPGRHVLACDERVEVVAEVLPSGSAREDDGLGHRERVFVVLSGTGTIVLEESPRRLHAGNVILVPEHHLLDVTADGTEPLRLLTVATPPQGYVAPRDVNEDTLVFSSPSEP
jgi:mannose-6-phosphate isomerase-like protein (cupin superfamily)